MYHLTKPDGNGGLFVLVDQQVLCFQSVWAEGLKKGGGKRRKEKREEWLRKNLSHTEQEVISASGTQYSGRAESYNKTS